MLRAHACSVALFVLALLLLPCWPAPAPGGCIYRIESFPDPCHAHALHSGLETCAWRLQLAIVIIGNVCLAFLGVMLPLSIGRSLKSAVELSRAKPYDVSHPGAAACLGPVRLGLVGSCSGCACLLWRPM